MDISMIAGLLAAAGLVAFALVYSRSNANHRSRQTNNDGTTSSTVSDTSSNYGSSSSKDADCSDAFSSCDSGGDGGGGD